MPVMKTLTLSASRINTKREVFFKILKSKILGFKQNDKQRKFYVL